MNAGDLVKMYELSYSALNRNLDGITNEESLLLPEAGGNSLNWVFGHIVTTRNLALLLVGGNPVFTGEDAAVYQRGSHPTGREKYLDLATLRGYWDDSQRQIIPAIAGLSDEQVSGLIPEPYRRPPLTGSLADALGRLHFHEAYHNGQIGLLRRFAGHEGAIK